jgi:hypothetical protein
VYCSDVHTLDYREKIAPLFKLLIERHGFKAIGLESHWERGGKISSEAAQFKEFFADLHKLVEKAPYLAMKNDPEAHKLGVTRDDLEEPLRPYFEKTAIFGLEDKDQLLTMAARMHYISVLQRLSKTEFMAQAKQDPKMHEHFRQYFAIMTRLCGKTTLPIQSLNDLNQPREDLKFKMMKFSRDFYTLQLVDRSAIFSGTLGVNATDRTIVLVGGGHLRTDQGPKGPEYYGRHISVQKSLEGSYLVVRVPGKFDR